ncbi:unnamed protein product, partial [Staurois parvus]
MISAPMISVAPSVPPVSVYQFHLSVPINATCPCPSVPHISVDFSCLSVPTINASQCCLSVPVSATYQ